MIETEEKFNFPRAYNVLCSFRWETSICKDGSYSITRTPKGNMPYSIKPIEDINDISSCVEI